MRDGRRFLMSRNKEKYIPATTMNQNPTLADGDSQWFAIKTGHDFRAAEQLATLCDEVLFPKEEVSLPGQRRRVRAIIPRVLFIRTTRDNALARERAGREHPEKSVPFWIYRYPKENRIQGISHDSIRLLRLWTADDTGRCEIFTKTDFKENQRVRVTGGPFKGYEGFVQRGKKNRHVIVRIEGICLVMLPFIHPDLLQPID